MTDDVNREREPEEIWGGSWTEKKLDAFSKYVWAYISIMKRNKYWKTIYFDGFAGSGNRKDKRNSKLYQQLHFTSEEESGYKGAAERVLNLKDGLTFDYYYFIDKDESTIKKLEKNLNKKCDLKDKRLVFKSGDANKWVTELAKALRTNKYAALIFLDPFGMQINWDSISSLTDTRSDIWILVPTGIIVNRLLDRKGELKHIEKLESFFGLPEEEIKEYFYHLKTENTLFGDEEIIFKITRPIEKIARLYVRQLKTIWTHVTENPLRLSNSKGVPIFHLVFASNNKQAAKIANQIIKTL
ncbi:MAG: three-Cys-motif partner protein TcmP [Bacteroidetes bacterium]|nr:three-Cys-motif partner protein TcmP [Bacteroidota bacterium]